MPTPWIVEPFDVIKYVRTSLVPGGVVPAVKALAFDRREEALDRRVVPAVAPPAHAAGEPLIAQQALEVFARVLAALVGVVQQLDRLTAPPDRHHQRIGNQLSQPSNRSKEVSSWRIMGQLNT